MPRWANRIVFAITFLAVFSLAWWPSPQRSFAPVFAQTSAAPTGEVEAPATVMGPATQPAGPSLRELDMRAATAMNNGQWELALRTYERMLPMLRDDPDLLGPVLERIRVCQAQMALIRPKADQPDNKNRAPHRKPADGQTLSLSIQQLGNFDYDVDKGGNIPDDVKALSGSTVALRGYMIPLDQAEHLSEFALVPSLLACCFGQPPQVHHTIVVICERGQSVRYFPDEIIVTGVLKVEEKKEEGYIVSIFEMTPRSVKPAPQAD